MSTTATNPTPPVIDPELPAPLSMGDGPPHLHDAPPLVCPDHLRLRRLSRSLRRHRRPDLQTARDAQQVTGVSIAYMLPIAVLGVIAGVFVDRWPTKPTMVSSDSLRAASGPPAPLRPPDLALLRDPRRHQRRLQLLRPRAGSGHPIRRPPPRPPLRQRPHAAGHVRHAHHRPRHRSMACSHLRGQSLLPRRCRQLRRLGPPHRLSPLHRYAQARPRHPHDTHRTIRPGPHLDRHETGHQLHLPPRRTALRHPRHGLGHVRRRMLRPADRRLCPRQPPRLR